MTASEVAETGTLLRDKNFHVLKQILEEAKVNPYSETASLKLWIAIVTLMAIFKGAVHSLDVLLNQITGRRRQALELRTAVDLNMTEDGIEKETECILQPVRVRSLVRDQQRISTATMIRRSFVRLPISYIHESLSQGCEFETFFPCPRIN